MKPLKITIALLFLIEALYASSTGSISGTVLDENGNTVSGAKVEAVNARNGFQGAVRYFRTNDDGRFQIEGLPLGDYRVFAKKEEDGYPDMSSAFYSDNVFPTAVLTETNPAAEMLVRLLPKAGILTGSVVDAVTRKPLNPALHFRRAQNLKLFLTAGTEPAFRVLVPSDVPVTLEISVPGYLRWHYHGKLELKPGETMNLDVQMIPSPPRKD
jgi:hypothetical protein